MRRLIKLLPVYFVLLAPAQAQILGMTCPQLKTEIQSIFQKKDDQSPQIIPSHSPIPRGVVLLVHGLNNKPSSMNSLGKILNEANFDVVRVTLPGHQGPLENMKKVSIRNLQDEAYLQYCQAKIISEQKKVPLHLVAFSLGALIYEELLNENVTIKFSKKVLFAPAITTRPFVKLLKILTFFKSPETIIPSWAPINYRAQEGSSLGAYQALFDLEDRLDKFDFAQNNTPTLVFIDPQDEVVFAEKIKKGLRRHGLSYYQIIELNTRDSKITPRYHHLIIDPDSLGEKEWQKATNELLHFLSDF